MQRAFCVVALVVLLATVDVEANNDNNIADVAASQQQEQEHQQPLFQSRKYSPYNVSVNDDFLSHPKFSVQFSSLATSQSEFVELLQTRPDHFAIKSSAGFVYSCIRPAEPLPDGSESESRHKQIESEQSEPSGDLVADALLLLTPLKGGCIYRPEGWWTYEYCHLSHIRQLHIEAENKVGTFYYLGLLRPNGKVSGGVSVTEVDATIVRGAATDNRASTLSVRYSSGSVCDLTNMPRYTDVKFVCDSHGGDHIDSIKETSTCVYEMVIKTSRLCSMESFNPRPVDASKSIQCSFVLSDAEAVEQRRQHELKTQQAQSLVQNNQQKSGEEKERKKADTTAETSPKSAKKSTAKSKGTSSRSSASSGSQNSGKRGNKAATYAEKAAAALGKEKEASSSSSSSTAKKSDATGKMSASSIAEALQAVLATLEEINREQQKSAAAESKDSKKEGRSRAMEAPPIPDLTSKEKEDIKARHASQQQQQQQQNAAADVEEESDEHEEEEEIDQAEGKSAKMRLSYEVLDENNNLGDIIMFRFGDVTEENSGDAKSNQGKLDEDDNDDSGEDYSDDNDEGEL